MKTDGLEKYHVNDLIIDRGAIRLVFLLESPYTEEVVHQHPLAGGSGRSMARFLVTHCSGFEDWDLNTPIGCQITIRRENRIALVNASNYPLDRSVFCLDDYVRHRNTIDAWNLIRKNPGASRRNDPFHMTVEEEIVNRLALRLTHIPEDALIVPCGDFAREILHKCRTLFPRKYTGIVPHPARNLWFSSGIFRDADQFIKAVNSRMAC